MSVPPGQREWLAIRTIGAVLVLSVSEALCGLFGSALQKSPSNFGCFFVVFTTPLGVLAGVVLVVIAEQRRMSNRAFVFLLAIVTVSGAALTLLYIATRQ